MGGTNTDARHHFGPISQQVLHGRLGIGEGTQLLAEELIRLLGHAGRNRMVDRAWVYELAECRQVALINDLVKEPLPSALLSSVVIGSFPFCGAGCRAILLDFPIC